MGALFTPISTQLSLYVGVAICMYVFSSSFASAAVTHRLCRITFCATYAANTWNAQSFPFLSQALFLENGDPYDQLSILDDDLRLDEAKLATVGLPWFAPTQVLYKIGANLAIGATITHVILWYGKEIIEIIKKERRGESVDPHRELMKAYPEVPMWWYGAVFLGSFAMAMATVYTSGSQLPWWGLIVALIISAIFLPFVVTVYAITGKLFFIVPIQT